VIVRLSRRSATFNVWRSFAGLALLCAAAMPTSIAGQERQRSVLTLYPTRADAPAVAAIDRTLPQVLTEGLAGQLDYYAEYIDLARFPEPGYQVALSDFLALKYQKHRLDLIIATTNAMLEFVERNRDDLFRDTPVVFSAGPGARTLPNSTGVTSGLNFRDTLDIISSIQPETQRVFVISGASTWDKYYETVAREQFTPVESRLTLTYLAGLPLPDLLHQVGRLPAQSAVYFLTLAEDGAGHKFVGLDSLDKVTAVANAPVYAWHSIGINHGVVGGRMQSSEVIATHIGNLALRVLRGERPEAIPVVEVDPHVNEFDWRELRRWRIDEARLPPGSTVHYRQPGVWQQYRIYIIAGVSLLLLQTALIAGLLVQRSIRRRTEAVLRQNQQRYAWATAAGGVGVWDWKLDSNEIFVDPELKHLLGYRDDEIRNHLDDWGRHIHPEDAETVMTRAQDCIQGRADHYEVEHRMLHRDGSVRWFLARGTVLRRSDGTPDRMVGTDMDITERKGVQGTLRENEAALRAHTAEIQNLAGRLIAAQEVERTRIARDLHDDVSQQLAGLSIALSNLKRQTGAPHSVEALQSALTSLQQRTMGLADSVRHLSHHLHPGVLQHAGLVAALTGHCADVERQHGLRVSFRADQDFQELGRDTALCLYRVAQEALHNTVVHAEATRADVTLSRSDGHAELTIADNGKGFDITLSGRHSAGLGLISIHERVRLAGGTISMRTEVNNGTTVQVQIPIGAPTAPEPVGEREHQRSAGGL
jgi:PAS domain S-box-containing protein